MMSVGAMSSASMLIAAPCAGSLRSRTSVPALTSRSVLVAPLNNEYAVNDMTPSASRIAPTRMVQRLRDEVELASTATSRVRLDAAHVASRPWLPSSSLRPAIWGPEDSSSSCTVQGQLPSGLLTVGPHGT